MLSSLEAAAGKTALAVGLARRLQKDGLRVSYLKPLADHVPDADAAFVREILEYDRAAPEMTLLSARTRSTRAQQFVFDSLRKAADCSDVLLSESGHSLYDGARLGISPRDISRALGALQILVLRYRTDLYDSLATVLRSSDHGIGACVLTSVPPSQLGRARQQLTPICEPYGIKSLAVLPQDRLLMGVTVAEIANKVKAQVVAGEEGLERLVERLMIGAMTASGAAAYFRRHANKAVITGGDRPDIHRAALGTPTRCLILTGGFDPPRETVELANSVGVPVLVVNMDTLKAVETLNELFQTSRFRQRVKVARFDQLLAEHFDWDALQQHLEKQTPS